MTWRGLGAQRTGALPVLLVAGWVACALAFSACRSGVEAQPDVSLTLPPVPIGAEVIALGGELHLGTCAVCHGKAGEGGIGPALVGVASRLSEADHFSVVQRGRGQMQAFRAFLDPEEIIAVVAYQRERFG